MPSKIVLITDKEATFKVPSKATVDKLLMKNLNQKVKPLPEGTYYCYKDCITIWGSCLGRILYTTLRTIYADVGYTYIITPHNGSYKKVLSFSIDQLHELVALKTTSKRVNASTVRSFKAIRKIFLVPHQVLPKTFSI